MKIYFTKQFKTCRISERSYEQGGCKPSPAAARELQLNCNEYQVADVQNLSFLVDQSFDLAVSYLNQYDLPDFMANARRVYRIIRNKGRFIIANLHPMRSAGGGWCKRKWNKKACGSRPIL